MAHIPDTVHIELEDEVFLSCVHSGNESDGFVAIRVGHYPDSVCLFFDNTDHLIDFATTLLTIGKGIEAGLQSREVAHLTLHGGQPI